MSSDKLKHKEITDLILKSFYEVYNELGRGFLESVYQKALKILLVQNGLFVQVEKEIRVHFRGQDIGIFKADMLVEGKVLLELKAVSKLESTHCAQVINYLRATKIEVGLLLNFGDRPEFKRFAFANERKLQRKSVPNPRSSAARSSLAKK